MAETLENEDLTTDGRESLSRLSASFFDASSNPYFDSVADARQYPTYDYSVRTGDTLETIAQRFLSVFDGLSEEQAALEIARLNNIEIRGDYRLQTFTEDTHLTLPLPADLEVRESWSKGPKVIENDFSNIAALTAPGNPAWGLKTRLLVTEESDEQVKDDISIDYHHKQVFSNAIGFATALNPQLDQTDINALLANAAQQSTVMKTLFESLDAYEGSVIISSSQSLVYGTDELPKNNSGIPPSIEPTVFQSAGNNYDVLENFTGRFHITSGSRGYLVAAADNYDQAAYPTLGDYSSPGADITGPPLPKHSGLEQSGTSFTTPLMAALDRQMVEWYGGILTQEEIMSAAYMSTTLNMYDSDPRAPDEPRALAEFETNGGGRPFHDRAGAGMIDAQRWNENLTIMAQMKESMQYVPPLNKYEYSLHGYEPIAIAAEDGSVHYQYTITVPEDVTLDRISLFAPPVPNTLPGANDYIDIFTAAANYNNIQETPNLSIRSPSGFEFDLPQNPQEHYGTSALSLEDIKAGQQIVITSTMRLTDEASITVRGHGDGNVVQMLRDHLQERDLMPRPLTDYTGNVPTANMQVEMVAGRVGGPDNMSNPSAPALPGAGGG